MMKTFQCLSMVLSILLGAQTWALSGGAIDMARNYDRITNRSDVCIGDIKAATEDEAARLADQKLREFQQEINLQMNPGQCMTVYFALNKEYRDGESYCAQFRLRYLRAEEIRSMPGCQIAPLYQ